MVKLKHSRSPSPSYDTARAVAGSSTHTLTPLIPTASASLAKKRKIKEGEEVPEKRMAAFKHSKS